MAGQSEEVVTLVRIDTGESVRTIADLKKYVDDLKKGIQKLEIGTEEYNDTLRALQAAQDAQKDAMHYGVQTVKAAKGSYNDLVHTMRELKEEWRATNDEARRAELTKQIADINTRLKDLDASVGVFSRGVGDYRNAIVDASKIIGGPLGQAIDKTDKSLKLFSKNPVMGVLALLAPLLSKIMEGFQGSEAATNAWDSAMKALQPVLDLFDKVLNLIVSVLTSIVDKFAEMASGSQDTFKKVVAGAVGVGNAILQFLLAPVKTIINAWKGLGEVMINVFKGDFKKAKEAAVSAAKGIGDAWKKGFSFKANFEKGQEVGEQFAKGLGGGKAKKAAADAGKKLADDVIAAMNARLAAEKDILALELKLTEEGSKERLAKQLELRAKEYEIAKEKAKQTITDQNLLNKQLLLLEQEYESDVLQAKAEFEIAQRDAETQRQRDRLESEILLLEEGSTARLEKELELKQFELDSLHQLEEESDEAFYKRQIEAQVARDKAQKDLEDKKLKQKEKELKAQVDLYRLWASNVTGLMGGIADAYEAMSDDEEKAAEDTKAIRIAAALIDTISGAIGAYMSAVSLSSGIPAPYNMILGAIQAATVTATGMANIAKMKSVNVKNGSSAGVSAAVSAPPAVQQVPVTRTATSASEEERLDQIASKQRVVLVYSDVQDAAEYVEVVQDETEF